VAGQGNLLEVVLALGARGGFAHLLHGRQEQADQDGNDGNHHQELHKRETCATSFGAIHCCVSRRE
jgi:hypothetical protein